MAAKKHQPSISEINEPSARWTKTSEMPPEWGSERERRRVAAEKWVSDVGVVVICANREVAERWWGREWSDIVAAVDAGEPGLTAAPADKFSQEPGTCVLRKSRGFPHAERENQTFVVFQGW